MDSFDLQISGLPIEIRLSERRRKTLAQAWRQRVSLSSKGDLAPSDIGAFEWDDLIAFHHLLHEAFELRQQTTRLYQELEVAQAQIASSPLDQWPALIDVRNRAQERLSDSLVKTQFLATQNYRFPEFFRDYVPLAVHALRDKDSA